MDLTASFVAGLLPPAAGCIILPKACEWPILNWSTTLAELRKNYLISQEWSARCLFSFPFWVLFRIFGTCSRFAEVLRSLASHSRCEGAGGCWEQGWNAAIFLLQKTTALFSKIIFCLGLLGLFCQVRNTCKIRPLNKIITNTIWKAANRLRLWFKFIWNAFGI